jgi:nucleotide-binding universal stress UspA family protein
VYAPLLNRFDALLSNISWRSETVSGLPSQNLFSNQFKPNQEKGYGMNFLVGYNGSNEAKSALLLARDFAKTFDAKVFVMTSMPGGPGESLDAITATENILQYAENLLEADGIECETHQLARGMSPGEDLVKFAVDNEIDQLFVGVEKKSKTQKMLLGSTAQYVILKAPCPVITVK